MARGGGGGPRGRAHTHNQEQAQFYFTSCLFLSRCSSGVFYFAYNTRTHEKERHRSSIMTKVSFTSLGVSGGCTGDCALPILSPTFLRRQNGK